MCGIDQRMTQLELSQLNRVEGFHFLFMQDLTIQNLDDCSDEDLWSTVWAYMIPVMPADSTSPSDEGRLARAIQLSPVLTLQPPSAERTCELIPLHAVPLNSTIRVYRRVRDPQNQDSIISVRYQVTSKIQLGRRLLKLIDLDQTSIHTPV